MKIIARADDGTETDVTEGVQSLYDMYMSTMDIGSGFICMEEALAIHALATACGFKNIEEIDKYVAEIRQQHREREWRNRHPNYKYELFLEAKAAGFPGIPE